MFRTVICWGLALFFLLAGFAHFTATDSFAAIVPPPLPFKPEIVQLTGAMELVFAIGLVVPRWRRVTGWLLSAYLLAVLPANIFMALEGMPLGAMQSPTALWFRVFLQLPLIALVLWATGAWTRRSRKSRSRPLDS